ncbi:MAG: FAD-binding oxidoreductase [Nanoarchaeota archaeon]|nr:FAD-binding oxidoreductase [Nanoarchaeota archaeon]
MKYEVFWKNPGYKVRPELKEDIECDYLIVGGGVAGVSLAYFLSKKTNKKIVLIEKNTIASGATGKAAGTLVLWGEQNIEDFVKRHGRKKGFFMWKSIENALKNIYAIAKKEKIECEAELQDILYCGFKHKSTYDLYKEYNLLREVDKSSKILEGENLKKEINTPLFNHGLFSERKGLSVNPLKFTQNLSRVLDKRKVKVYENTSFISKEHNLAHTHQGDIKYRKIIFAIDADHPSEKVQNLKSTLIATRPLTKKEADFTGLSKKKIIWDAREHYNYFKLTKENRLLVGFGGVIVHKKHKMTDPHFPHLKQIKDFTRKLFPYLDLEIEYAWSGHFGVTDHYSPLIEFKGDEVSIAGASTQVNCVMAADYISDKLAGRKSKLEPFFNIK